MPRAASLSKTRMAASEHGFYREKPIEAPTSPAIFDMNAEFAQHLA